MPNREVQKTVDVERLKRAMARKGWTQKELAKYASVSDRTIQSMLEEGKASLKTIVAVAETALGSNSWEEYCVAGNLVMAEHSSKKEEHSVTYQQLWEGPGSLAYKLAETARLYPSRSPLARSQLMALSQDVTIRIDANGGGHVRYAFKIANVGSQPIRGTSRHLWFANPQDTARMNLRGQWNGNENLKIIMETDFERNKQFFLAFPRELKPFATCRFHFEFDIHEEYPQNAPKTSGDRWTAAQNLASWEIYIRYLTNRVSLKLTISTEKDIKFWQKISSEEGGYLITETPHGLSWDRQGAAIVAKWIRDYPEMNAKYGLCWELS